MEKDKLIVFLEHNRFYEVLHAYYICINDVYFIYDAYEIIDEIHTVKFERNGAYVCSIDYRKIKTITD